MGRLTYKLPALVLLAATTSVSWAAHKSFDKHFDVSAGGQLVVNTSVGSVAVVGQDSRQVVVHAEITGSEAFVDDFTITAEQQSSDVTVRGYGSRSWLDWFFSMKRVHFVISVPRDYRLNVQTSGGSIDVRNLTAAVKGRTSGGGISVQDVTGAVDMRTSGGGIDGNRLEGPTELETSGGGIDLTDCTGNLDVHTSGGSIRVHGVDGRIVATTSGGSIYVEAHANRGASLITSGGSVTLLLPADAHATLDAETSGGGVRVDFPLTSTTIVTRTHVRGAINGGGDSVALHTSGGSVHVGQL